VIGLCDWLRRWRRRNAPQPDFLYVRPILPPTSARRTRSVRPVVSRRRLAVLGLATVLVGLAQAIILLISRIFPPQADADTTAPKIAGAAVKPRGVDRKPDACTLPPDLEFIVAHDCPEGPPKLNAWCGKCSDHSEETLPRLPPESIQVEPADSELLAVIRTARVVESQALDAPHGIYLALLRATGKHGRSCTGRLGFNYIYRTDFRDLRKTIISNSTGFRNVGPEGGLHMERFSKEGKHGSADLQQRFDFREGFQVWGHFTLCHHNESRPAGFDMGFCDAHGERLAVILPDGHADAYSIKGFGEDYDSAIPARGNGDGRYAVVADGSTHNYFLVCVWCQPDGRFRCRLYLGPRPPQPRNDACVHQRVLDRAVLGTGIEKISLKLWGSGAAQLFDYHVAELPPACAEPIVPGVIASSDPVEWNPVV